MKFCLSLFAAIALSGAAAVASAATIFSDNFESYADTAAMQTVWGNPAPGTLDTAAGNPGKSLKHTGGASNTHSFTGTTATDANPLVWQFDYLDDGAGNKRLSGALRDVNGSATGNNAFFEMGRYNSINDPESGTTVSGYGIRTAFVGGPSAASGWISYVGNPLVRTGWHRFTATIGATSATFALDFIADGSIDASRTVALSNGAGKLYNLLRFGGPSDVSSAGGGGNFDNVSVSTVAVPEPASFALAALAGVALVAARRRKA
jgi:hypothetical protein